jgi:hypothetical protein
VLVVMVVLARSLKYVAFFVSTHPNRNSDNKTNTDG